ncbi:MAG: GNAT family N-acetyltransferase [Solirubrobacterales bacterium]
MAIEIRDNPDQERIEIHVDGELAGFTVYRRRPGIKAFVHTEIDPEFEGQGLGGKLIAQALDDARAAGDDVLPFCPFVNHFIKSHDEYRDLVPEDMRSKFGL